jgi:hypothetical protein
LVYHNAFTLLMQDVVLASVVGKAVISGVRCDHLLFSRPGLSSVGFRRGQAFAAPATLSAPQTSGKPLPLGTVVSSLPPGCVPTPVGGVEYYYGGGNFYRAAFQGNKLVYVTAKPE